jgi:uncharacterized membrane protein
MNEIFSQEVRGDTNITPRTSRSIPDLASDAFGQLAKLIGNEFDLARAELSAKAGQAARASALIGAGAIIMIPALVVLLIAIASAIVSAGLSQPVAYAVTGGGAAIIAVILIIVGANRLSAKALKPAVTLGQVQRDKMAVKEMTR